jgi:hypothetical protein
VEDAEGEVGKEIRNNPAQGLGRAWAMAAALVATARPQRLHVAAQRATPVSPEGTRVKIAASASSGRMPTGAPSSPGTSRLAFFLLRWQRDRHSPASAYGAAVVVWEREARRCGGICVAGRRPELDATMRVGSKHATRARHREFVGSVA